jgi:hypothetical protein
MVLILAGISVGVASADPMPALELPPGIEDQAQPYLAAMMERMQDMGMSHEQQHMMMEDMQAMADMSSADRLPPGVFLQILALMPELTMPEMMTLHQAMHQGDLLQQSPGQILLFVQELAG